MSLIRDEEFEAFLPPPADDAGTELEEQLVKDGGPRDPVRIWKGHDIIVDGYRRHEICERRHLPYRVEEVEFKDRAAVLDWMLKFQLCRRNLTPHQQSMLLHRMTEMHKAAGERKVAKRVAKEAGVAERSVFRANAYADALESLPTDIADKIEIMKDPPSRADVIRFAQLDGAEMRGVWNEYLGGEYSSLGAVMRGESQSVSAAEEEDGDLQSSTLAAHREGDTVSPREYFADLYRAIGTCKRKADAIGFGTKNDRYRRLLNLLNSCNDLAAEWEKETV